MIHDLLRERPRPERRDVCIVGAGAAGITLAVELQRLGRSVYLLEGGGAGLEEAAQEPYRSELRGLPHRGIHDGRFRAHGGTTTKWGGQILELDAIDFEPRDWVPESGWPFPKSALKTFYNRALQLEGVAGAIQSDEDVWKAIKRSMPQFPGLESYCSRWCPEPNFAILHRSALAAAGIEVWLHANVVGLVREEGTVRGVRCRTQAETDEVIFSASEYVFCLGAIESCRFFLQAQESSSCIPWNQSGLLGRHFQDHVDCNAATVVPHHREAFHDDFDDIHWNGYKYTPKLRMPADAERRAQTLNAAAYMYYPSEAAETLRIAKEMVRGALRGRLSALRSGPILAAAGQAPLLVRKLYRLRFDHRTYKPSTATGFLRVHCEQRPDSESSITLADERDSLGMLRTRLDWRVSAAELRTIQRFVKAATEALAEAAAVTPDPLLMDGDPGFIDRCEDTNHHMGGMRMHPSPAAGVVDTDLKLNGIQNCYICSSAVFPSSGYSNPTHTLLALTVRLAAHLHERSLH